MKWPLVLLITVLACSGCQSQQVSTVDPFFGRTRVSPPGTGTSVARPPADPYYRSPVTSPTTPSLTPVPQNQPAPGYRGSQNNTIDPTRSLGIQGSRVRVPESARSVATTEHAAGGASEDTLSWTTIWPEQSETTQAGTARSATTISSAMVGAGPASPNLASSHPTLSNASGNPLAGRERIVRTLQPLPAEKKTLETASTPTLAAIGSQPALLPIPAQATDIMDLPRAGTTASAPRRDPGFRLASDLRLADSPEVDSPASTKTVSFSTASRYGYDPNYAWLRGKLEYSHLDRRWKLRYIPIDGDTDDFGGSVVLDNPSLLEGCERGDFVEIHGTLDTTSSGEHGYAPLYKAARIKRLD